MLNYFLVYLLIGWTLTFIQGWTSYLDGYLTQGQLRRKGITGWAFVQHGGMWADVCIITPITAYILARYGGVVSPVALKITFIGAIPLIVIFGLIYGKKATSKEQEAHRHDGKMTAAGWVHGLYTLAVGPWIVMFYLNGFKIADVHRFHCELICMSILLTPYFLLGAMKFNLRIWRPDLMTYIQSIGGPVLIWVVTLVHLNKNAGY